MWVRIRVWTLVPQALLPAVLRLALFRRQNQERQELALLLAVLLLLVLLLLVVVLVVVGWSLGRWYGFKLKTATPVPAVVEAMPLAAAAAAVASL
jgi:ABC-type sulfate transport system permease component